MQRHNEDIRFRREVDDIMPLINGLDEHR